MTTWRRVTFSFLALLLQIGCAAQPVRMYEGIERSSAEVARVKGMNDGGHTFWNGLNRQITIRRVDNAAPSSAVNSLLAAGTEEVILLPGKHTLLVKYNHLSSYAYAHLWLVAEAGKTYTVQAISKGYSVLMAVVDDATQKTVGGVVGSIDEPTSASAVPAAASYAPAAAALAPPATQPAAPAESAPPPMISPASAPVPATAPAVMGRAGAAVRGRPRLDAAPIIMLSVATPLQLMSTLQNQFGTWWLVSVNGRDGWMTETDIVGH